MTDDTARRERAEKYLNGDKPISVEDSLWARGLAGNFDDDYGVLVGYLAGAREEAAIKEAEIAALREFVRWHFTHHPQSWPGNAEIMPAVHRALEEKP